MEVLQPVRNKVPFKVSARTARLIGRENIATSKGAIIELVKNGYDAGSAVSIVYFDNRYSSLLLEINQARYDELVSMEVPEDVLLKVYEKKECLLASVRQAARLDRQVVELVRWFRSTLEFTLRG